MNKYDVAIIGAGAAGLSAAAMAVGRRRRVVVFDMGAAPARKVELSGGGRCNFTNMAAGHGRYFGQNPDFVRGALARVSPGDMLQWARDRGLHFSEKAPGQFFCDDGAAAVVRAIVRDAHGAQIMQNHIVADISKTEDEFIISGDNFRATAARVIIATGGISFDSAGVSDFGYKIARKFGHKIIPPRPALCAINTNAFPAELAGISMPVEITVNRRQILGDMLFTHFGIGGPAVYSASLAEKVCDIVINLCPGRDMYEWLRDKKKSNGKKTIGTILSEIMPTRIAKWIAGARTCNIADMPDGALRDIANRATAHRIPAGTWRHHGMRAAEVTFGGVDTHDISSKTMESKLCPGLFFAGEVMDITGDLGGFNLQWAWSSGRVAGQNA